MKKILYVLMICLSLVIAKSSLAGTCEGGKEFPGTINGHNYCASNVGMTWWASFEWCKKQGRKLASMNQLCPDWSGATGANACPNMKSGKDYWGWASNPAPTQSTHSYYVNPALAHVGYYNRSIPVASAICY